MQEAPLLHARSAVKYVGHWAAAGSPDCEPLNTAPHPIVS